MLQKLILTSWFSCIILLNAEVRGLYTTKDSKSDYLWRVGKELRTQTAKSTRYLKVSNPWASEIQDNNEWSSKNKIVSLKYCEAIFECDI